MRALLERDHPPVLSVYTGLEVSPSPSTIEEIHLPTRPDFGRIDHSRFHSSFGVFDGVFQSRFESRLRRVIREHQVKLIHIIPHGYDIVPVHKIASDLKIPLFLTIHDDLEYTAIGHPLKGRMVAAMGEAWRAAEGVFVICDEIGQEYARRYGEKKYAVVTDGLISVAEAPQRRPARSLRVYFMGLFHPGYKANLRALLDALKIVRNQHPDWDISVTSRSGYISCPVRKDDLPVRVIPFAPQSEVDRDMLSADLLYLPLPFEAELANFGKFSMSTKMVTYLGSGLPILYHGPRNAAACNLLASHQSAITCTSLDAGVIAKQLIESALAREAIVNNALQLARKHFMLAGQQRRFWEPIVEVL
jgi:hypothetical protein